MVSGYNKSQEFVGIQHLIIYAYQNYFMNGLPGWLQHLNN
jgi:hypothetical protein